MLKKRIILTFLFTFVCGYAFSSEPIIFNVNGNISDGNNISIEGENFGNRKTAKPVSWLGGRLGNIETGANGKVFSSQNWQNFTAGGNTNPKYTDSISHSYSKSVHLKYYGSQYGCGLRFYESGMTEVFVSAWFRIKKNDKSSKYQYKIFRTKEESLHDFSDTDSGVLVTPWSHGGAIVVSTKTNKTQKIYTIDDFGRTRYWGADELSAMQNRWVRMDFYHKRNSSAGASDGKLVYDVIGLKNSFTCSTAKTHLQGDTNWNYFILASYYGNLDAGITRDANIYLDDIYVANTLARVELCNDVVTKWSSRFSRGAECAIQPTTAWGSGQIEITLNQGGTFKGGENAYLYVVDSNGNVNSTGKPIKIGGSTSTVFTSGGNSTISSTGGGDIIYSSPASNSDSNDSTSSSTSAGTSGASGAIIVDNDGPGTKASGSWVASSSSNYYGTRSVYSKTVASTYAFEADCPGLQEVYLWWTYYNNRHNNVPVQIYDGTYLIDTVNVNQLQNSGKWNLLGTYNFTGKAKVVVVSKSSVNTTNADAVKFAYAGTASAIAPPAPSGIKVIN
jgi:hypothetical protein